MVFMVPFAIQISFVNVFAFLYVKATSKKICEEISLISFFFQKMLMSESAFLLRFKANYLSQKCVATQFSFVDSNSPCKDPLSPRNPNLAQKPLYLVGTVLKVFLWDLPLKRCCRTKLWVMHLGTDWAYNVAIKLDPTSSTFIPCSGERLFFKTPALPPHRCILTEACLCRLELVYFAENEDYMIKIWNLKITLKYLTVLAHLLAETAQQFHKKLR